MNVIRHEDVCGRNHDIFVCVVETNSYGIGLRIADYQESYVLRIQAFKWHLCWHFDKRKTI